MNPKKQYIKNLAIYLTNQGKTMSGFDLAKNLNHNNFKTNYGTNYSGKRGTYTLVKSVYKDLVKLGQQYYADKVALAFVKKNGTYAYL
ncbi:hypothetical protein [Chryseobacterium mucoviscidosis]|uniref:hypothetical protein n=1 Tax=Chryseobacterium mucoviscidosis TaxID=1945581 RepID=UPI0031D9BD49